MMYLVNKILCVGDEEVGKTSLLHALNNEPIPEEYEATHLTTFQTVKFNYKGDEVSLHLWDIGGDVKYSKLAQYYYKNIDVAIIVFDLSNKKSFDHIRDYACKITVEAEKTNPFFLFVGNKSDLVSTPVISEMDIDNLCEEFYCRYLPVSSKNNFNISRLVEILCEICDAKINKGSSSNHVVISDEPEGQCCNVI